MITRLAPDVRKVLVEARCIAMKGDVEDAIVKLDRFAATVPGTDSLLDKMALSLLKAELRYLDGDDAASLEIFKSEIDPHVEGLPYEVAFVIADNRNCVSSFLEPESTSEFYHAVDVRRIAGTDLWNADALLAGVNAATENKHYDALPQFWAELLRAYKSGYWRSCWVASRYMATECLQLELPHEATHFALLARDEKLAKAIGDDLLARRTPELISAAIVNILSEANLRRHASVGCAVLNNIADAVPAGQLNAVLAWLLKKCTMLSTRFVDPTEDIWKALAGIAPALQPEQALCVIQAAVAHPLWQNTSLGRKHLVRATRSCVGILAQEKMHWLAEQVIPLATGKKHDYDYVEVIELLVDIAERGGPEVKTLIANALYPAHSQQTNAVLAQVAPFFEKQWKDADALAQVAETTATRIRKQVQRLPAGEKPETLPGTFGTVSRTSGSEQIIAHQDPNAWDLQVLVRHKSLLRSESLNVIVEALLNMIRERENLLHNKRTLIFCLGDLAPKLTEEHTSPIFEVLAPLAAGQVSEPSIVMSYSEATNSLNPYQITHGNPSDVCGAAMCALAQIEAAHPGVYGARLDEIVESALHNDDSRIRGYAFHAARDLPKMTEAQFTALLLGTRDPEPVAAESAFSAIAAKQGLQLSEAHWRQLLYSIKMVTRSPKAVVRLAAARVLAMQRTQIPTGLANELAAVERDFAADVCFSVRSSLSSARTLSPGGSKPASGGHFKTGHSEVSSS